MKPTESLPESLPESKRQISEDKAKLRQGLLAQRQALSPAVWAHASELLCAQVAATAEFQAAQRILAYFSHRQEPDLSYLWRSPPGSTKQWGFPRCVGLNLHWFLWRSPEPLMAGKFGILEPSPEAIAIAPETADLILVPAVACDRQGNRLGYGGGYYDRFLSQPHLAKIPTIGIVFEFAQVKALPREPWDRQLHGVSTELGYKALSC